MHDQRMLWIREAEHLSVASEAYTVEAELGSELLVPGDLEYAAEFLRLRPVTSEPDAFGLYKYVLRLRCGEYSAQEGEVAPPHILRKGTRKGYVIPGGPITELVALISLCLEARFFVLAVSTRRGPSREDVLHKDEHVVMRGRYGPSLDPIVFSKGDRSTVYVRPLLDKVRALPPAHHLEIAVAANHYAEALRTIGVDEEMVFVRLVSAIERVMGEEGEDTLSQKLQAVPHLTAEEHEELSTMLLARRARARFVTFLEKYSERFFDSEAREPAHTQVTPENLADVASSIYAARSAYLHNGDPMWLSPLFRMFPHWHMDAAVGLQVQDRAFSERQKLPRADFFHRLVRHCLLARIEELVAGSAPSREPAIG